MQKNWLDLILLILATYRLAKLITVEDGPFDLMLKIREWVFSKFNETHWLNKGLSCPWCVSFWLALGLLFVPDLALWWLGIAGAVSLLFSWEFRDVTS